MVTERWGLGRNCFSAELVSDFSGYHTTKQLLKAWICGYDTKCESHTKLRSASSPNGESRDAYHVIVLITDVTRARSFDFIFALRRIINSVKHATMNSSQSDEEVFEVGLTLFAVSFRWDCFYNVVWNLTVESTLFAVPFFRYHYFITASYIHIMHVSIVSFMVEV